MISTIGWIIIWIGVLFDLLGAIGLIRFPDVYNRLQASTKCVTLGTVGIMIGIFLIKGFTPMGVKALICGGVLLLTSPVAAHALMKGSLHFARNCGRARSLITTELTSLAVSRSNRSRSDAGSAVSLRSHYHFVHRKRGDCC